MHLTVSDWPLAELERFERQRPHLYAQMRTRLLALPQAEPPSIDRLLARVQAQCAEMRRLQADGKLQNVPARCLQPARPPPPRPPGPAKATIGA